VAANQTRPTEPGREALGGLTVRDLSASERQAAGLDQGVVITNVREGSAADEESLAPEMVIEEVGGKPVTNVATFTRLLQDAKTRGKHAVLLVRNGDDTQFVALRLKD
jgi:serine protease Do